ncbi:polyglutamine-binding protein 1-like [Anneissia japonica]|uniref:polyglutamine-binding protein 1-like n=1 Tax=Anneissia japonica TaxID=1529436 RepID=UPI001425A548|nr:polyglutamine-binding protein 1-like [Anneissia japonica]
MSASRLPPALAARLKKRGIIQQDQQSEEPDEEIIAADYSGEDVLDSSHHHHQEPKEPSNDKLPPGWFRIKDPISGYHYFWDSETDKVSWLHPLDPKAKITEAASKLRGDSEVPSDKDRTESHRRQDGGSSTRWDSSDRKASSSRKDVSDRLDPPQIGPSIGPSIGPVAPGQSSKDKADKGRQAPYHKPSKQSRDSHRKKRGRDDELDPMDPASYSDVPRGDWSTGLPTANDAKTGADVTATGPLFQSRPYPNPGAILRANAGQS